MQKIIIWQFFGPQLHWFKNLIYNRPDLLKDAKFQNITHSNHRTAENEIRKTNNLYLIIPQIFIRNEVGRQKTNSQFHTMQYLCDWQICNYLHHVSSSISAIEKWKVHQTHLQTCSSMQYNGLNELLKAQIIFSSVKFPFIAPRW